MTQDAYEAMCADVARALRENGSLTGPPGCAQPGTRGYADLVADITTALRVPAGIRGMLGAEHDYHAVTADVADLIDTRSGLEAIVGSATRPPAPFAGSGADDLARIREAADPDRLLPRLGGWHVELSAARRHLHNLRQELAATGSRPATDDLATVPARLATQDVEIGKVAALLAATLPRRRARNAGDIGERRRTVSILFVDIVGFTALVDKLDVAEVRGLQRDYFTIVERVVRSHGGRIEKYVGDAVLAVFGLGPSSDNGAGQAVRAGLRLQAAFDPASPGGRRGQVRVRIGVATGDAIVDTAAGRPGSAGMISGSVVAVAARMQAHAEPGEVVVAEATHSATAGSIRYSAEPRSLTVAGRDSALKMWRAIDTLASGQEAGPAESEPERSELSDRDRQYVAELGRALGDVADELGRIVSSTMKGGPTSLELRRRCLRAAEAVAATVDGLWRALSDFRGADLESVGLEPAGLEVLDGVCWSDDTAAGEATRWPEGVRSRIAEVSHPVPELGPGVFVIRSGTAIGLSR